MVKRKKGFTLVELVIVIAIISILAVVIIFTYSSFVDRAKNVSRITAERYNQEIAALLEVEYSAKIVATQEVENCPHDGAKFVNVEKITCFVCYDCGECGINAISYTTKTPTTSTTGVQTYEYLKNGEVNSFTRTLPKVKSYDWFWAFYNDLDSDGLPEFNSLQYIGETTIKYQYKYVESDFADYPHYDAVKYNGITDEQWDKLYEEYEKEYDAVDKQMNGLDKNSNEYKELEEQKEAIELKYADLENDYCEIDEAAYQLYQADVKTYEETTGNIVGNINPAKTKVVTEEQKLYYFLHTPFDYDSNKSYPVLIFYPGSGAVLFSTYKTSKESATTLKPGNFYYDKYRQTQAYNSTLPYTNFSSSAIDAEGNWLSNQLTIRDASWCGSFFSNWYNQVKTAGEGRDKYDCFILFIMPSDSGWFSSSYYVSQTNQVSIPEIKGAIRITSDMTSDTTYKGYNRPTYDSSYVSAAPDAQLACSLIDQMALEYNIDYNRQYVAGGSLGGAFTMDVINHYHNRFACAIPVVAATADITEATATAIVQSGMNIWSISGDSDNNCNKYFSKLFIDGLNAKKTELGINDGSIYQYSFFPGGHACSYIGGTLRTATKGVSITSSTQVLDFMFNSSK